MQPVDGVALVIIKIEIVPVKLPGENPFALVGGCEHVGESTIDGDRKALCTTAAWRLNNRFEAPLDAHRRLLFEQLQVVGDGLSDNRPVGFPAAGEGKGESAGTAAANERAPFWEGWFVDATTDGASTVEVRFSHHLSSGSLTVWMDGKKILSRELETETKGRTLFGRLQLKKPSGSISEVFTVEPGLHRVEALVESPEENVSVRGERELDLSDGQTGRLVIALNRWFGKRLALKWK